MIPAGLETQNDCAGEDQQQITLPTKVKILKLSEFFSASAHH
jgi:hypothetical protein